MQEASEKTDTMSAISRRVGHTAHVAHQEMLGNVVRETLLAGKSLDRTSVRAELVKRLEAAGSAEEEQHYRELLSLV